MPGPGKWHLRGPIISILNHICESDGFRVRLASIGLRLGGLYGGLEKFAQASAPREDAVSAWAGSEGPPSPSLTRLHVCTNWGTNTDAVYILAGSTNHACLVIYDVRKAHPLFKQSTWSRLRKPNRRADLPSAECTGSDLFSLHLWLDPFTKTPRALHIFG